MQDQLGAQYEVHTSYQLSQVRGREQKVCRSYKHPALEERGGKERRSSRRSSRVFGRCLGVLTPCLQNVKQEGDSTFDGETSFFHYCSAE